MALVRMVNPNDGQPYEFEDKYAKEYAGKGWTPYTPAPVGSGSPEQQANTARVDASRSIPAGPHFVRDLATRAIPGAAAAALTALAPEAAIPMRLLLALVGGTTGELGGQKIRQEPLSLPGALLQGGIETGAQGLGEALDMGRAGLAAAPRDLASQALALPPKQAAKAGDVASLYLREGIPVGKPGHYTGTAGVDKALGASHAAEDATVNSFVTQSTGAARKTVSFRDLANRATKRITDKFGAGLSKEQRDELYALADETAGQVHQEKPADALEVLQLKRAKDNAAAPTYTKMQNGASVPLSDMEQKYVKALADEARGWLRENVPNLGRQMQRTSELIRLKPAMSYAESPINDRAAFGVKGIEKALSKRASKGEAALKLRGPAEKAANISPAIIRQSPRAAGLSVGELLRLFNGLGAPADTTR